jgi:TRAP-type uncharacterized transport system fused permease subunit
MSGDFEVTKNQSESEGKSQDHMVIQEDKNLIDYLVTLIAIGMSIWHIHLAFTGGYESTFQRSLTYLFGMPLIFLVFRDRTEFSLFIAVVCFNSILFRVCSPQY